MSYIHVYVGKWGIYQIPHEVAKQAKKLTPEHKLRDRRTKGAKHIARWGKEMDSQELDKARNANS